MHFPSIRRACSSSSVNESRYPVDTFRWYICRDAIYGCDLSFSKTALVLAHNAELCDTLGNLVHRSLSLMSKYNDGKSRQIDVLVCVCVYRYFIHQSVPRRLLQNIGIFLACELCLDISNLIISIGLPSWILLSGVEKETTLCSWAN